MSKESVTGEHVNREKTRTVLHHAIDDVQHAARPGTRSPYSVFSWVVALGAGAVVAWRSLQAADSLDLSSPTAVPAGRDAESGMAVTAQGKLAGRAVDGKSEKRDRKGTASQGAAGRTQDKSGSDCPAKAVGAGGLLKEFWCRYQTAEVLTRSQALAFIGVLSLGPVLLFALAALGFVIRDTAQVERFVHDLVGHFLPGRQASEAANNLIAQTHIIESARALMKGKWWAISIGVVSLIWAAVGLFVGASDPMNVAWNVRETRGFVKLRLVALGVFLASGVLFLLSLVPSALPSLVGRLSLPLIGSLPRDAWWLDLAGWLLALVINAAMFTFIYKFLPNARARWKSALFGGAVAGVLWELFKKGFAVYLGHFGDYNKLYGALGGAVLLVTWIWYSCVLLLAGAILCTMYQEHAREGGVRVTSANSARGESG